MRPTHFPSPVNSNTMLYVAILVLLTSVVSLRAATTPEGVSDVSSFHPIRKTGVKTDFATIFSAIYSFQKSHKGPTRDLNERDTITPPPLFAETFGPINAANNADGYMGYQLLTTYDADACAQACNTRAYDHTSGPCIYFNIWQAVINGTASAITCSMYNTFTDASTATNTGQGNLQVSLSRGFSRFTNLADGSFQDYTCILDTAPQHSCPFEPSNFWTRVYVQGYDFVLVNNFPAHSGTSSCFLLFNPPTSTSPAFGSTLTYTQPLNTTPGQKYIISFFYTMNTFSPTSTGRLFSVFWNNENVLDVLQVGTDVSFQFLNAQVEVTATGPNDTLFFKNGVSFAHALYLDDIAVFQKWF